MGRSNEFHASRISASDAFDKFIDSQKNIGPITADASGELTLPEGYAANTNEFMKNKGYKNG